MSQTWALSPPRKLACRARPPTSVLDCELVAQSKWLSFCCLVSHLLNQTYLSIAFKVQPFD